MKLLILLVVAATNAEEIYGNVSAICMKCVCNRDDTHLDCQNQGFTHIVSTWPYQNTTTIIATFSQNNIATLEQLPPTDAVVEIVLSHCNIKYLKTGLFANAKNTKFVDLSHNELQAEELSADKFKGPYNDTVFEPLALEHLDLSYNKIHSIGKNVFEHLPNLKELNLEGNDFTILDIHTQLAISSIRNLKSLNLANNELTELVRNAIEKLNITKLNLAKNKLDFVPGSLVHIGKSLEILILDDNPIFEFVAETFLGLENINELSANNLAKLRYINANTFVPLSNLKKLSLSDNVHLKDIDREAFAINQTLEEFYLNNNALYRIDHKLLQWSSLRIFEFRENPLDCSCDLYNITMDLSRDITRNEDGPYCTDPRIDRPVKVFYLKSDICQYKSKYHQQREFIQRHFSVMRMVLIILSIVLMIVAFVALALAYIRFRKFQRNKNYPYASQVLYNPLSINNPRF